MSDPQVIHSNSKKPAGTTAGTSTQPSVAPPRNSPSGSTVFVHLPGSPSQGQGDEQREIFLPTDCGEKIAEDSDNPDDPDDPDPDDENDKTGSQPEISLARSLTLLAKQLGTFSKPKKLRLKIQQCALDTFDGTDPGKLETFLFQVDLYMAAHESDFPDKSTCVLFALSYLKGVPLDWFQGELARVMNDGTDSPPWFTTYSEFANVL